MKQDLLQQYSPSFVQETLEAYVTEARRQRIEEVIEARLHGIQLAIEAPSDINNALAAVRTCEALGIDTIHIIAPEHDCQAIHTITQGAYYWVNIRQHHSLQEFQQSLNQGTTFALAGGLPDGDIPLHEVPVDQPICFFIGNEQRGLSPAAQSLCDYRYRIPMCGMTESLNLSVAAAISLYDASQRKRASLKQPSDLTPEQQVALRAKFYLNSVSPRLAEGVLEREAQSLANET